MCDISESLARGDRQTVDGDRWLSRSTHLLHRTPREPHGLSGRSLSKVRSAIKAISAGPGAATPAWLDQGVHMGWNRDSARRSSTGPRLRPSTRRKSASGASVRIGRVACRGLPPHQFTCAFSDLASAPSLQAERLRRECCVPPGSDPAVSGATCERYLGHARRRASFRTVPTSGRPSTTRRLAALKGSSRKGIPHAEAPTTTPSTASPVRCMPPGSSGGSLDAWERIRGPERLHRCAAPAQEVAGYIRSGAVIPIRPSTRPRAIFAADTSRSRAAVSAASSVITFRFGSPCWRKASLKAWNEVASSVP